MRSFDPHAVAARLRGAAGSHANRASAKPRQGTRRRWVWLGALCLLLGLGSCGDLPQPFRGRPGSTAARLAVPLAVRLAVPPPQQAMLPDSAAAALAEAVTTALQAQDLPAVATAAPLPLDWLVEVTAERQGQTVLPRFRLLDADRQSQASAAAEPVPLRAWSEAQPETFARVAEQAAPALTRLLLQVEAARKATDPASLAAGPPRLRMAGVRGAPGDGNTSLANRMRDFLGGNGFVVQETADGAQYAVQGDVAVVPGTPGQQRVEIQWIVSRRDGEELGRVVQVNEVPAGSLSRLWGDVAYVVAEEAAGGVRSVVANAMAAPPTTMPEAAAPQAAAPQAAAPQTAIR